MSPIDDTPASKAGILAGDVITRIDGKPIRGLSLDGVVDKLRGVPGSKVTLTIQRANVAKPLKTPSSRRRQSGRWRHKLTEGHNPGANS